MRVLFYFTFCSLAFHIRQKDQKITMYTCVNKREAVFHSIQSKPAAKCLHWKTIPIAMRCKKKRENHVRKSVPSSWRMAKKTAIITIVKKGCHRLMSFWGLGEDGRNRRDRYVVSVHYDLKHLYSNTRRSTLRRPEQQRCRWDTNKQTNKKRNNKEREHKNLQASSTCHQLIFQSVIAWIIRSH